MSLCEIKHDNRPPSVCDRTKINTKTQTGTKRIPRLESPVINETLKPGYMMDQRTPYQVYFTRPEQECQGQIVQYNGLFVYIILKIHASSLPFRLTTPVCRDKIIKCVGMVELVDSLDLGAVTSVKVFQFLLISRE